ncbi:MAG: hypothetical protein HY905_08890 [Deltaproteobacteria bacterium]|nr:hypothetical protein [Deltaproteobacteria bacterium]
MRLDALALALGCVALTACTGGTNLAGGEADGRTEEGATEEETIGDAPGDGAEADGADGGVEDGEDAGAEADAEEAGADDGGVDPLPCGRTDECLPGSRCNDGLCESVLPTLDSTGADLTCLRDHPPPIPGVGTVALTVSVMDFTDEVGVEGATVDLFFDGIVDGSPDATVGPTDGGGRASAGGVPRDNRIASRVRRGDLPGGLVRETVQYDVRTPDADGALLRVWSVDDRTYRLIPTILGISPDAEHGVVFGKFDDCAGVPVEGFVVQLVLETGEDCRALDERECRARYFQDRFFSRIDNQPYSSADGLFALLQVPPGSWTARVMGRLADDAPVFPYELLGEKRIVVIADAVAIVTVEVLPE